MEKPNDGIGASGEKLYERINYDALLEVRGFRQLAEMNVAECRSTLKLLIDRLDITAFGLQRRAGSLLLLDLLQRLNRKINRPETNGATYHRERTRLTARFAEVRTPDEVRNAFLSALDRLLEPLHGRHGQSHPLIRKAQAHIDEHYNQRLSLSSVAASLNVSPNYLSRLFRQDTGMTLTNYIQRVRLEHAMLLLAEGERSISEIAYIVGYQNYRDFYRNFVKYEHTSPRQIKRKFSPQLRP